MFRADQTLRYVRCSGEALSGALLGKFRSNVPNCAVINLYGTTEVSGDCTAAVFGPTDISIDPVLESVTIGAPIAGAVCR